MGWAIFFGILYLNMLVIAWNRGWVHATWYGIKGGTKRVLTGPVKAREARPDYAKIQRLERDLGIVPATEEPDECARGGHGCGAGCSAPAVRDSVEDRSDIYAWGAPSPIRSVIYPRPQKQDPPARMPRPPRPQTDRK